MGFCDYLRRPALPVRDRLRNGATPYLEQGEQIQAVFLAAPWTPSWAPGKPADRAVVATDRRILLFKLDFFQVVKKVTGQLPRETKLGPGNDGTHHIRVLDIDLAVPAGFCNDVKEADRAAGFQWPAPAESYAGEDLQDLHIERNLPGAVS